MALIDSLRKDKANVALVCATNRPASIDPSIRRPGRLDTEITLGTPSKKDKLEILKCCVVNMPLQPEVDLSALSDRLQGFMAGDIASLVFEAAMYCVKDCVSTHDGIDDLLNASPVVSLENFDRALVELQPSILRNWNMHVPKSVDVRWEDIAGLEEIKKELKELIEWPIYRSELLEKYGVPHGGGALMYGPPGCGKTLLAKAVASSCSANFLCINGPELLGMWLGESERNIREIFAAARFTSPCVIFIDEIDALAPRRTTKSSTASGSGDIASRIVGQLLCEIDGLTKARDGGIVVLGATNRPAAVDPALLRPGRLGTMVHVPLPDHESRCSIIKNALKACPVDTDFDLEGFLDTHRDMMEGFSAADVKEFSRRVGTQLVRDHINIETQGYGKTPCAIQLNEDYLWQALSGMRRSVSQEDVAYFEEVRLTWLQGT